MKITYNNKIFEINNSASIQEAFKEEIQKKEYPVIGAVFNNEYKRLDYIIKEDGILELIDLSTKEGMKIYRSTLIFVMAMAFEKLYPRAKIRVNYQLSNSMFCTIQNMKVRHEVLKNVENEMKKIVKKNLPIVNKPMTRKDAEELYAKERSSKGRLQLDLQDNEIINMYYCEDYYNYIYENIAINTGIANIFELVKYDKGFLLRYPSSNNPLKIPRFKDNKKILWALNEYNDIHKKLIR